MEGKKKFFAGHFDQAAIRGCCCHTKPLVSFHDQRPCPKNMANGDVFMTILASLSNPSDANRPFKKAKHSCSRFTRTKQNLPRLQQNHIVFTRKSTHGEKGIA